MRIDRKPLRARGRNDRGFIIVAVLWILMALATLVSIYATYVINTAFAVGANDDRIESEALVTAAVELTAYQLTAVKNEDRPASGSTRFRLGPAAIALEFHSEAARVDLNAASKDLLSNLFVVLGAPRADADEYAARIVGWRTRSTSGTPDSDTETALYRAAGRNFSPRQAAFPHAGELWLVLGLPPVWVERAMPYVTVFSGQPRINILDAAPAVIAALPGMTPDRLTAVLGEQQVQTKNAQRLLDLLGPAQGSVTTETGKAVRVNVGVQFDNGRRLNSEVVILLIDDEQAPYRVLSWRDDFDQLTPAGR